MDAIADHDEEKEPAEPDEPSEPSATRRVRIACDGGTVNIRVGNDTQYDRIITKSVSRFARNTVDTLTAIRKLKEYGVEVYFEEQNIYTLDGKGELLLTIISSIA